ncbi:MAG: type IV secretion system DNA-binding domain-containing protein [Gemmatimonas sp.]
MATNNFLSLFEGGTKNRELKETRAAWERAEATWRTSPLASLEVEDFAEDVVRDALNECERMPASPIVSALCDAVETLIRAEAIAEIEPLWPIIESNLETAVEFREVIERRALWAANYAHLKKAWGAALTPSIHTFVAALPSVCFENWEEGGESFGVPLIDLIDHPAKVVHGFIAFAFEDNPSRLKLFNELRAYLRRKILNASGVSPEKEAKGAFEIVPPEEQEGLSAREVADLYLGGTPFAKLLELSVPFAIPAEARFEHCHIVGGTGHGKTQLLQKLIHADLVAAQHQRRSVVVIDSQGDLIQKLSRLELFSPHVSGGLGEKLILIDPADVEHPAALNLFDAHLDRLREYDPADRERVLNGVVELYETFFDALLGAELTQRQDVVFRYIARLMLTIPGATIHTLMDLMDNGKKYKPYMEKLEGSGRRFFETEFFSPSFTATKSQIQKRLWGVLSTPAFERMFSQKDNKLDLFSAMNEGKIILVNTAKDLLKEEGSRIFGRFFTAMLAQAALERSTIPEHKRTPTFVYVDEAHEYVDDRVETILNQARKYKVGLTLAHQHLDQLSTRLRSTLLSNTSVKCVGGVSAKDARALAEELHTTPEFIGGMKRSGKTSEFALWVKHVTPRAIRLTVPLGFLERQHTLDEEDYELLLEENRAKYCGDAEITELPTPDIDEVPGPPAPYTRPVAPSSRPPLETEARDAGKGGPRHTYLQSLIKGLAEEAGLRASVEAMLPGGGQVDVLVEQGATRIAFEVSVTTPVAHEVQNVAKCLSAGIEKVVLVLARPKREQAAFREAIMGNVPEADRERVFILVPEEIPDFLVGLASPPDPEVRMVKGYKVKGGVTSTSPEDARTRHEAVARIIAGALAGRM